MGKGRLDGRWKRGREGDGTWSAEYKKKGRKWNWENDETMRGKEGKEMGKENK